MSAQLVVERQVAFRGLRPLDPRRDLKQVADLIEEAFADELEPGGKAALRDLRTLARMGPLVSLMARSDPALEDVLGGYVWVEDGRIVGNVTVQRTDPYGARWQIANVAVTRDFQQRGIGRALVQAALDRIVEVGGSWAVLQVRVDNDIARRMYRTLGFEALTEEVVLRLPRLRGKPLPVDPPAGLRPYQPSEWQARYELEVASRSALAQWWRPIYSRSYMQGTESRVAERLWELLGRNRVRRWVVPGAHGLMAWLSIDGRRWRGVHDLQFTVHPACRGEVEGQLVAFALGFLDDFPRWPLRVELQGEHRQLVDALTQSGFKIVRSHLAMRTKIAVAGR